MHNKQKCSPLLKSLINTDRMLEKGADERQCAEAKNRIGLLCVTRDNIAHNAQGGQEDGRGRIAKQRDDLGQSAAAQYVLNELVGAIGVVGEGPAARAERTHEEKRGIQRRGSSARSLTVEKARLS